MSCVLPSDWYYPSLFWSFYLNRISTMKKIKIHYPLLHAKSFKICVLIFLHLISLMTSMVANIRPIVFNPCNTTDEQLIVSTPELFPTSLANSRGISPTGSSHRLPHQVYFVYIGMQKPPHPPHPGWTRSRQTAASVVTLHQHGLKFGHKNNIIRTGF